MTVYQSAAMLVVGCPCGAGVGVPCRTRSGRVAAFVHDARRSIARGLPVSSAALAALDRRGAPTGTVRSGNGWVSK